MIYNETYRSIFRKLGLSVDWDLFYETISDNVQKASQKVIP